MFSSISTHNGVITRECSFGLGDGIYLANSALEGVSAVNLLREDHKLAGALLLSSSLVQSAVYFSKKILGCYQGNLNCWVDSNIGRSLDAIHTGCALAANITANLLVLRDDVDNVNFARNIAIASMVLGGVTFLSRLQGILCAVGTRHNPIRSSSSLEFF